MCASNSHSYTHLILALGIVREPTVWGFITSKYPGTRDIGLPTGVDGEPRAPVDNHTSDKLFEAAHNWCQASPK